MDELLDHLVEQADHHELPLHAQSDDDHRQIQDIRGKIDALSSVLESVEALQIQVGPVPEQVSLQPLRDILVGLSPAFGSETNTEAAALGSASTQRRLLERTPDPPPDPFDDQDESPPIEFEQSRPFASLFRDRLEALAKAKESLLAAHLRELRIQDVDAGWRRSPSLLSRTAASETVRGESDVSADEKTQKGGSLYSETLYASEPDDVPKGKISGSTVDLTQGGRERSHNDGPALNASQRSRASNTIASARTFEPKATKEDLELVQSSIERAYAAIPQLENQRSSFRTSEAHEQGLERIWDRFDRLHRMDDQRANASAAHITTNSDPPAPDHAVRSSLHRRLTKTLSLGSLLATARSQVSDSASSKGKGKQAEATILRRASAVEPDLFDLIDTAHARTRMADQDAKVRPKSNSRERSSLPRPPPAASSSRNALEDRSSAMESVASDMEGQPPEANSEKLGLQLHCEWHSNLGRLSIVVWSGLVGAVASLSHESVDGTVRVCVRTRAGRPHTFDVALPAGVTVLDGSGPINNISTTTKAVCLQLHTRGEDETIPMDHRQLRPTHLAKVACRACGTTLCSWPEKKRLMPLPVSGWEELVDAWMCHDDQHLNQQVLAGRAALDQRRSKDGIFGSTLWLQVPTGIQNGVFQVSMLLPNRHMGAKKTTTKISTRCLAFTLRSGTGEPPLRQDRLP